ncbi:MAG: geranylgeranylglycerol-phosphate geranylgeranyltransferase, partial [Ginsengibacter sp.]
MNMFSAFFKLIRWPNLFFIALTQFLFKFFIIDDFIYKVQLHEVGHAKLPQPLFFVLVLASVCIAAAGYIINDYFDLNIDLVNKPEKLIIEKFVKRRWAIVLHIILSAMGLVLSLYVGYKIHNYFIPFFNLIVILALWFYSTTFKKKLLVGNVIISLLTAWVILVLTLAEYRFNVGETEHAWRQLVKISSVYAAFAFILSLVREVIKDMEDMPGDAKYGCHTMPIVWGIRVSKVFSGVWLVVLTGAVVMIGFYLVQLGWWLGVVYSFVAIILPLAWVMRKLYEAQS